MSSPFIRQALLQEAVDDKVRCLTCERRCLLAEGQAGWCRARQNCGSTIYTLIYGLVSSLSCNPIEKKPLFHFYPGSVALTAGSLSCNFDCPWCQNWHISKQHPPVIESASPQNQLDCDHFDCPWCQNWHISKQPPFDRALRLRLGRAQVKPSGGEFIPPDEFVARALSFGCQGTSISFNEPTLSLEWALEVFPLARGAGLYNTFVTNGYMTQAALRLLVEAGLDGMNVDVKGGADAVRQYCGADVEIVWRNCRLAREMGVWIELTTLVVPGVNDDASVLEGIARRVVRELGSDTPFHLSGYHPNYRFTAPPTPVATLERGQEIGLQAGLRYVYLGNVPGHSGEHTFCPNCGTILAERGLLQLLRCDIAPDGRCPRCGQEIAGVGWHWRSHAETLAR
jgi:pyruvate formate lyase activating enzyme